MPQVPSGGPSTINGINYQMLWALITLGGFRASTTGESGDNLTGATLILEPSAGGDQQQHVHGKRVIVQLKARSDEGTWSLQEILRDVLPDLYLAVDVDEKAEYHFVTEGTRGEWKDVEVFFASLKLPVPSDPLSMLDSSEALKFRRVRRKNQTNEPSFWSDTPYTQHRLFERIVESLRDSRESIRKEPIDLTRRKTWTLLAGFKFLGGNGIAGLRKEVDRWLIGQIGSADKIEERRNSMLQDLAFRATRGDEPVDRDEFLRQHNLNATSLTEWAKLSKDARDLLLASLSRRRIDPAEDVRPRLADELYDQWTNTQKVLVLTGEGGEGKTWLGCQLLLRASTDEAVGILVESPGGASGALTAAASRFWNEIVGHDEAPPFVNLRKRLDSLGEAHRNRRLCIFFDGVVDAHTARELVLQHWDTWGMHAVLACPAGLTQTLEQTFGEHVRVVKVGDFSAGELQEFLEESVGPGWPEIPDDVRNTLKRPLLARLYRDLSGLEKWRPTREYELYQKCWDNLVTNRGVQSLDLVPLMAAACTLINGAAYPWTREQLVQAGMSPDSLERLVKSGWITTEHRGAFAVWHDRLLSWTIAEAMLERIRGARSNSERDSVITDVCKLQDNPWIVSGRTLGYVPMDFLWLLLTTGREAQSQNAVAATIDGLSQIHGFAHRPVLFHELLPTLGPAILPELLRRLEAGADASKVAELSKSIAHAGGDEIRPIARRLLGHQDPRLRRAGLKLLRQRPDPAVLDEAWKIHSLSQGAEQARYLFSGEEAWSLYADSFGALKACVAMNPSWIVSAVKRVDPRSEPAHDLAYLLAGAGDATHWEDVKSDLFAKVESEHARSLAVCVSAFRDRSKTAWLQASIKPGIGTFGPACLRALARIDVDKSLESLSLLSDWDLYVSRFWCFAELLARVPDRALGFFHEKLVSHENPWSFVNLLQGHENHIEVRSLEFLLDALVPILETARKTPTDSCISSHFSFLLALGDAGLLESLRARRGQPLEHALKEWLIASGPQQGDYLQHDKFTGLRLLALLGGKGLEEVVCNALGEGDNGAKMQAIEFAERCRDTDSEALLTELTQSEELWDGSPTLQGYAARTLATRNSWKHVLAYYDKWKLRSLTVVDECRPEPGVIRPDDLLPNKDTETCQITPGVALGLAFAGQTSALGRIRSTFLSCPLGSELSLACAIALARLGDQHPSSVNVFGDLIPINRHVAISGLYVNRTPSALKILLDEVRKKFDAQWAAGLLELGDVRADVSNIVREQLVGMDDIERAEALDSLVTWLGSGLAANSILLECTTDAALINFIRERAFRSTRSFGRGRSASSIRLLALRDPVSAFLAAEVALRDVVVAGRECWPYLLVELDKMRAIDVLLKQAAVEPKTRVLRSIGRSLAIGFGAEAIRQQLIDPDARLRRTACRLAGWMGPDPETRDHVKRRLDDLDSYVADAALVATESLARAEIVRVSVSKFQEETDHAHRWCLLDGILAIADPGDDHGPLPWWVEAIKPHLSGGMGHYLGEKLKRARDKAANEADRQDR